MINLSNDIYSVIIQHTKAPYGFTLYKVSKYFNKLAKKRFEKFQEFFQKYTIIDNDSYITNYDTYIASISTLTKAIRFKNFEVFQYIYERCDINLNIKYYYLKIAASFSTIEIFKVLSNNDNMSCFLLDAIYSCNLNVCEYIINNMEDINKHKYGIYRKCCITDCNFKSFKYLCDKLNINHDINIMIIKAIEYNNVEYIKENISFINKTHLLLAIKHKSSDIIKILIKKIYLTDLESIIFKIYELNMIDILDYLYENYDIKPIKFYMINWQPTPEIINYISLKNNISLKSISQLIPDNIYLNDINLIIYMENYFISDYLKLLWYSKKDDLENFKQYEYYIQINRIMSIIYEYDSICIYQYLLSKKIININNKNPILYINCPKIIKYISNDISSYFLNEIIECARFNHKYNTIYIINSILNIHL